MLVRFLSNFPNIRGTTPIKILYKQMYGRVQVVEAHQDGLLKCHLMDLQHQLNCDCDHDTKSSTEEL